MSLAILFHFLYPQHVSDTNISIIRNLRLFCWITTSIVLFLVRCVLEFRCGWVGVVSMLQAEAQLVFQPATRIPLQPNHTETPMSETCGAHKKWNKIASDIKLVFYSSTITMVHGPINIRLLLLQLVGCLYYYISDTRSHKHQKWTFRNTFIWEVHTIILLAVKSVFKKCIIPKFSVEFSLET